jgi:divalent metal cation (Fe/Co/Zn/Cd) transporter
MRTVLVAGGANIIVAVIKAVAGVLTGSSAMLAESAHSVADSISSSRVCTAVKNPYRSGRWPPGGQRPAIRSAGGG